MSLTTTLRSVVLGGVAAHVGTLVVTIASTSIEAISITISRTAASATTETRTATVRVTSIGGTIGSTKSIVLLVRKLLKLSISLFHLFKLFGKLICLLVCLLGLFFSIFQRSRVAFRGSSISVCQEKIKLLVVLEVKLGKVADIVDELHRSIIIGQNLFHNFCSVVELIQNLSADLDAQSGSL